MDEDMSYGEQSQIEYIKPVKEEYLYNQHRQ
jgi:hypothetical protein